MYWFLRGSYKDPTPKKISKNRHIPLLIFLIFTVNTMEKDDIIPPFAKYDGDTSFFGGTPPLSEGIGYLVVLGFGAIFSIITTILVLLNKYFGAKGEITSEHFK